MRLGLIGDGDATRLSGVYAPQDNVSAKTASNNVSGYAYKNVFNALSAASGSQGFCFSADGTRLYATNPGAKIVQYNLSIPFDVSSASYQSGKDLIVGDYESSLNGVDISSDGTRMFFTGIAGDTVFSCTLSTPYDLATATVDVKKVYVGGQDATPYSPFFGDSGTKMYVMGNTNDRVYQYTLSTAWDVSTATYANKSLLVTALDATPGGLFFKGDGTKLYFTGFAQDIVASYTLSTAWDVSTGTADYVAKSFSVATQITTINTFTSIFIGDSGTKMYALAGDTVTTDTIFQYTLSTAWNTTTASYASKSFSVNAQEALTNGMFFKDDGTKLYTVGTTNDTIYQYTLSTAWDISTASYDSVSFSVAGQDTAPAGLFFDSSGTRMYVTGSTGDDVSQYSLSTAWNISTASFVRVSAAVGDTLPQDVFFKDDGTKMYILGSTGDAIREFTLSTAWDVSTISFRRAYSVGFLDTLPAGLFFKSDGTEIYIAGAANRTAYQLSLTTAWDSASVTGRFYVGNEETDPRALFFKPDGTKMFAIGTTGDDVNEYDLSTAWNIGTASFVRVSAAVGEANPTGLWFKDDGTKMYVTGTSNDTVREFTLSTAWNVSTISFSKSLSIGFETVPTGVSFKDDGSMLYVVGHTSDTVFEIQLGTAWDVGTAKGYLSVGGAETAPRSVRINSDGSILYLIGSNTNTIRSYMLSTAYELGTASDGSTLSGLGGSGYGLWISPDGTYGLVGLIGVSGIRNLRTSRGIRRFNMTTPHTLSTGSFVAVEFLDLNDAFPYSVAVSPDGTSLFALVDSAQGIHQFSLRFA